MPGRQMPRLIPYALSLMPWRYFARRGEDYARYATVCLHAHHARHRHHAVVQRRRHERCIVTRIFTPHGLPRLRADFAILYPPARCAAPARYSSAEVARLRCRYATI